MPSTVQMGRWAKTKGQKRDSSRTGREIQYLEGREERSFDSPVAAGSLSMSILVGCSVDSR